MVEADEQEYLKLGFPAEVIRRIKTFIAEEIQKK